MRFHLHPDPVRLFDILSTGLENGRWAELAIAVAWARESAVLSLTPVLRQFLEAGGRLRLTVGVGLQGTSTEALEALLDLERFGDIAVFVYHNEATEETFHPKIYLFTAPDNGRLIVGSSNLTDGGLSTNIEAALDVETAVDAPAIVEAGRRLGELRDTTDSRVRRLDRAFIGELTASRYVVPEAEIRTRRAAAISQRRVEGRRRTRLFGTVRRQRAGAARRVDIAIVAATVLLLRPRRASETARRTQVQIPIRLTRTPFFNGVTELVSAHDNRAHGLRRASARGGVNTIKVELPEIDAIDQPVLRLTRRGNRVIYEAFSSDSELGRPITEALEAGFDTDPPTTVATITDRDRATLYRFV